MKRKIVRIEELEGRTDRKKPLILENEKCRNVDEEQQEKRKGHGTRDAKFWK